MINKQIIFWAVAVLAMLYIISSYNTIVSNDEMVNREWADLDASLQRRLDLIPNLVETVKGYSSYESEIFEAVTKARASVGSIKVDADLLNNPEAMAKYQQAQGQLGSSLSRLLAVAENYPDLKASTLYRDLLSQLEGTENRINVARQNYNDAVKEFNATLRTIPYSIINKYTLNLGLRSPYAADAEARTAPKVNFGK